MAEGVGFRETGIRVFSGLRDFLAQGLGVTLRADSSEIRDYEQIRL